MQIASTFNPEVILMDISMPLLNGIEATRQILAATPAARIVILSVHIGDECVDQLIKTGVSGFSSERHIGQNARASYLECGARHDLIQPLHHQKTSRHAMPDRE